MSFFSFLGKAGKAVGKVALGVGKTAINVAGNVVGVGNIVGAGSLTNPNPAAAATSLDQFVQQAAIPVQTTVPTGAAPSLGGALTNALNGVGDWLSGRTTTNNNVSVGTQSGLPSWLLPVGLGAGALFFLSSMNKNRRY